MSHTDKVEVMDFLINVLKDHEKSLDTLITRAEDVIEDDQSPRTVSQNPPPLKITLRDWTEFKDRAIEAELVCFEMMESIFLCKAITSNKVYIYKEKTPEIELEKGEGGDLVLSGFNLGDLEEGFLCLNGKLEIGLELVAKKVKRSKDLEHPTHKILHELDARYTKNWLSRELGIHRELIVQGSVD
ncbi:MAG: hypothetical protein ACEROO_04495 [Candidatus Bathyarchaeota archaeon]